MNLRRQHLPYLLILERLDVFRDPEVGAVAQWARWIAVLSLAKLETAFLSFVHLVVLNPLIAPLLVHSSRHRRHRLLIYFAE